MSGVVEHLSKDEAGADAIRVLERHFAFLASDES